MIRVITGSTYMFFVRLVSSAKDSDVSYMVLKGKVIMKPWAHAIKEPVDQLQFKNPEDCFFKPLFEQDENQCHFVHLKEKKTIAKEEVSEENKLIFKNNTIFLGRSILVGNI